MGLYQRKFHIRISFRQNKLHGAKQVVFKPVYNSFCDMVFTRIQNAEFPLGKALQSIFLRPFGLPSNCTLSKHGAGMSIQPLQAYSDWFDDFAVLCLCYLFAYDLHAGRCKDMSRC